ncbi:hypothetical protein [Urbifossiella limnaea]|uniref:SGNH/GDSL hydrolase family protein n=1 Tax=Urbifossiella limnaea TaxID=2528023 RepID=A0A517Y024_9BACT|nr:hypothetical protein [Urbifossiella limnaea]QDU23116.1 hypothetical protein ETAA1_51070 [Urbifossiella limnaea]
MPRRRRAAVAVGVGAALAVLLQLGLGVAAELSLFVRDPGYADKEVRLRKQFAAHPGAPSVVMLGTSRTGYGFYSARIREQLAAELGGDAMAFNYGIPASGPVTHLTYLRRLLDAGLRPDLLLVEVLPPSIAALDDGPLEARFLFGDRLKHGEVEPAVGYGFPAEKTRRDWRRSVTLPWHQLRFPIMGRVHPSALPWHLRYDWSRTEDPAGWSTPVVTDLTPEKQEEGLKRAAGEYGAILADMHPTGGGARALADLLALCREQKLPVRLVLMPESEGFRALYPPATTERLYAFLAALEAEYGAPLIDARTWLSAAAFTDGHHMLRPGAEAFSDRLVREAVLPFFRGRNESR